MFAGLVSLYIEYIKEMRRCFAGVCVCVFMYLVISESEATECKFKSKIFFPSGSLRPKLFWVLLMYTVW